LEHRDELCEVLRTHLLHNVPAMRFDRVLAEAELGRNLLIEFASCDTRHDLNLTVREPIAPLAEERKFGASGPSLAIALKGLADGHEQIFTVNWFWQEFKGTGFHGTHGHRDVAVARDEDHRQVATFRGKLVLKLEAPYVGHANVEHQAGRGVRDRAS